MATHPKSKAAKAAPARTSVEIKRAEPKSAVAKSGGKTTARKAAPAEKRPEGGNGHREGIGEVAEQSAREVFETLTRWRGEVANAAEAMAETFARDAGESSSRFAALLVSQREMLEQIKTTLGQFQELLETCEKQLEAHAKAAGESKAGGEQRPMEMPLHALQSFQQIALSNIGVWTKIAQDAQGLWLGAMQLWVPKKASEARTGAAEEHD
jgi:hypothetical protein